MGLNRPVDRATAERMCQPGRFLEAILAPGFEEDALEWLRTKPTWRNSVRLRRPRAPDRPQRAGDRRVSTIVVSRGACSFRAGTGSSPIRPSGQVATRRWPTEAERRDLAFAWRVCASVKSNAIVLAKDGQVVGVGAGQMSRLDSVRIAVEKAGHGPRARCWRPTPSSRFATAPTSPRPPASPRSSSPADQNATTTRPKRLRRARHGHDLDRPAPFPALTSARD